MKISKNRKKENLHENFLSDVKDFKYTILAEDGVNRHIRFKKDDSLCYWFDLITWEGHLCITGDVGTYVFSRITDMFNFFNDDNINDHYKKSKVLKINPHYWGEKLQAISKQGGYEQFSEELLKENIDEAFSVWAEDKSQDVIDEMRYKVDEEIISLISDDEREAYDSVYSFEHYDEVFPDFFEYNNNEFTRSYIWCLYAIVWGIIKYKELKKVRNDETKSKKN